MDFALFWGGQAQETQKAFEAERERDLTRELAEQQAAAEQRRIELAERTQQWTEENARRMEQFNLGVMERNEIQAWASDTINILRDPTLSLEDRRVIIEGLGQFASASPIAARYYATAQGMVRSNIVADPQEALEWLHTNVMNAAPGSGVSVPTVRLYAEGVADFQGWTGQQREDFINMYVESAEALNAEKPEVRDANLETMRLNNAAIQQGIDESKSLVQTRQSEMEIQLARLGMDQESHAVAMEQAQYITSALASQATIAALEAENMPYQLQVANRTAWLNLQNEEKRSAVYGDILTAELRSAVAQADINEETARHLIATGDLRDAMVQRDYDRAGADIDWVLQQVEESDMRVRAGEQAMDMSTLSMQETRLSMLATLVEFGNGDLVRARGEELLAGVVDEELIPGVIDSLATQAEQRGDADLKSRQAMAILTTAQAAKEEGTIDSYIAQARAEADVATGTVDSSIRISNAQAAQLEAQATLSQFAVDTFHEDREFRMNLAERGMSLDERAFEEQTRQFWADYGLRVDALELQRQKLAAETAGNAANYKIAVMDDIANATGWDLRQVQNQIDEYATVRSEALELQRLLTDPDWKPEEASETANRWGFISRYEAEARLASLLARAESLENGAITGTQAIIRAGMSMGVLFDHNDFGVDPDDDIYTEAWRRSGVAYEHSNFSDPTNPQVANVSELGIEASGRLSTFAHAYVRNFDPTADATIGPETVYTLLSSEFGGSVLREAGLDSPADVIPYINEARAIYSQHAPYVEMAALQFGRDPNDRQTWADVQIESNNRITQLEGLRRNLNTTLSNADAYAQAAWFMNEVVPFLPAAMLSEGPLKYNNLSNIENIANGGPGNLLPAFQSRQIWNNNLMDAITYGINIYNRMNSAALYMQTY